VFATYAIVLGLGLGLLFGGRLSGLATLTFRGASLAMTGLLAQLVLFSEPVAARVGSAGPPIYVASSALVLGALLRNLHIGGLRIVAVGAISNFAAIVANGGSMPASTDALKALGKSVGAEYSNSVAALDPALPGLTDAYALPTWMPFANVFSIGDVLIGVGIAVTLSLAMRREVVRRGTAPVVTPPRYQ